MPSSTEIAFDELVRIAKKLPSAQWRKLKYEVDRTSASSKTNNDLLELLLNGPTFSTEQIDRIASARKAITTWRTK